MLTIPAQPVDEVEQVKQSIVAQLVGCSAIAEVRNDTDFIFELRQAETRISAGTWIAEPPEVLPAHATAFIASCSSAMLSGTSAKIVYTARRRRVRARSITSSEESSSSDSNDDESDDDRGDDSSDQSESSSSSDSNDSNIQTANWENERIIVEFAWDKPYFGKSTFTTFASADVSLMRGVQSLQDYQSEFTFVLTNVPPMSTTTHAAMTTNNVVHASVVTAATVSSSSSSDIARQPSSRRFTEPIMIDMHGVVEQLSYAISDTRAQSAVAARLITLDDALSRALLRFYMPQICNLVLCFGCADVERALLGKCAADLETGLLAMYRFQSSVEDNDSRLKSRAQQLLHECEMATVNASVGSQSSRRLTDSSPTSPSSTATSTLHPPPAPLTMATWSSAREHWRALRPLRRHRRCTLQLELNAALEGVSAALLAGVTTTTTTTMTTSTTVSIPELSNVSESAAAEAESATTAGVAIPPLVTAPSTSPTSPTTSTITSIRSVLLRHLLRAHVAPIVDRWTLTRERLSSVKKPQTDDDVSEESVVESDNSYESESDDDDDDGDDGDAFAVADNHTDDEDNDDDDDDDLIAYLNSLLGARTAAAAASGAQSALAALPTRRRHRLVSLCVDESVVLSSRNRAPYMLFFESVPVISRSKTTTTTTSTSTTLRVSRSLPNRRTSTPRLATDTSTPTPPPSTISSATSLSHLSITSSPAPALSARSTSLTMPVPVQPVESFHCAACRRWLPLHALSAHAEYHDTADSEVGEAESERASGGGGESATTETVSTTAAAVVGVDADLLVASPILAAAGSEDEWLRLAEAVGTTIESQPPLPPTSTTSTTSTISDSDAEAARRSALRFAHVWRDRASRVRRASAFGRARGWRLCALIFKAGDDMRQEQLAVQLIKHCDAIFRGARLPLWLYPYEVLATSATCGFIEAVPSATSLDALRRETSHSLLQHFIAAYGQPASARFVKAQKCFVESLAAYSLVCYLLQIKDRHNGNMLIDRYGHIIHIDYGFMLTSSPGALGFETAPFKLTQEMMDVMASADMFRYFQVSGVFFFFFFFVDDWLLRECL